VPEGTQPRDSRSRMGSGAREADAAGVPEPSDALVEALRRNLGPAIPVSRPPREAWRPGHGPDAPALPPAGMDHGIDFLPGR